MVFVLLGCGTGVGAAENVLTYGATLSARANDNFSLSESQKREVYTGTTSANFGLGRNTQKSNSSVIWSGQYRRYEGDDQRIKDYPSQSVRGETSHVLSERVSGNLAGKYIVDRTTADEIEVANFFFVVREKQQDKKRTNRNLNGTLSAQLSERVQLQIAASTASLRYRDAQNTQLVEYDYNNLSISVQKSWTEQIRGRLGISGAKFEPRPENTLIQQLNATASKSQSLNTGLVWQISETFLLDGGVSWRRTQFEPLLGDKTEEMGRDGTLKASQELETGSWSLSASRSLDPTSDGRQVRKDELSFSVSREFSKRSTGRFRVLGEKEVEKGFQDEDEEKYGEIGLTLKHRISEEQYISFNYRHRKLFENEASDQSAVHSNSVSLSWSWTPHRTAF